MKYLVRYGRISDYVILKRYNYYFDFYSNFHGYFLLGPDPHLYNTISNIYQDYQYIRMNTILTKEGYNNWILLFNKIIIKDKINDITYDLNNKTVQFDFNLGLIIGTTEYQKFIEQNFFNNLITEKICNTEKIMLIHHHLVSPQKNVFYIIE